MNFEKKAEIHHIVSRESSDRYFGKEPLFRRKVLFRSEGIGEEACKFILWLMTTQPEDCCVRQGAPLLKLNTKD